MADYSQETLYNRMSRLKLATLVCWESHAKGNNTKVISL